MRVLFTTQPTSGHWHPLIPLARELRSSGHEVAFATTPSGCCAIRRTGFQCFAAGADESAEETLQIRNRLKGLTAVEHAEFFWREIFAGSRAQRAVPDLMSLAEEWNPDVIVRETLEFAGYVIAEALGLPHVAVQISAWRPHMHRWIADPLDRLRATVGLQCDPDLRSLYRYLFLTTIPPSLQRLEPSMPPTAQSLRPVAFDQSGDEELPGWVMNLPGQYTIYASMGTAVNQTPSVFEAIIDAARDEACSLIVTTGRDRDPSEFGRLPPNVYLERYIPQSLIFPHCDLVVTHGGNGTIMAALAHGLPMVIIPVAADQPHNARRCRELGVARTIHPGDRSPEAVRAAVSAVRTDPGFRRMAEQLQQEILAMPGPDQAVTSIQQLIPPTA